MPGLDDKGQPWHMSVFQALYVISYTATTIGFGEIPYPFSQAQRLWTTFSIYFTVIPWFYAIGKIITLLQDSALKQAIASERFSRAVALLQEPFYILCSYGQSAALLAKALDHMNMRVVVIERSQNRLDELELTDSKQVIPHFCGDAMPVSYTHLDVYKRQATHGTNPGENFIRMALVASVEECVEAAKRMQSLMYE